MKIKISGNGARIGYTRLSDSEFDWLCEELGSNPLDQDLKEFCSYEDIWDEINFKHDILAPYYYECKLFVGDQEYPIQKAGTHQFELPKISFVPGESAVLELVKDYRGTWFLGDIDTTEFDIRKLVFEVVTLHNFEVIKRVLYGNKEVTNLINVAPSDSFNTYVSLQL